MKKIIHDNIIYVNNISIIGGVETFVYELAKKYKDLDIAVVCKTIDSNQLKRLIKLVPVYFHYDEKIYCKVAIINYDTSIIDYINDEAKIYQVIHGDYTSPIYKSIPHHDRVYKYLGITKYIVKTFKEITGFENVELCYNPLEIEHDKKIIFVTLSRLSKEKGLERMRKFAYLLDKMKINYLWFILTNNTENKIESKNIIYVEQRLDDDYFIDIADYLVQLSDSEALSYSINKALYKNKPVIVTPLPYLEEIGVIDNVNSYIINFDCSNIKDVIKKLKNPPKFKFKKLVDNYDNILYRSDKK